VPSISNNMAEKLLSVSKSGVIRLHPLSKWFKTQ
jgi:hypothetical protein